MRAFYLVYRDIQLPPRQPRARKVQPASGLFASELSAADVAPRFPLPWSHYVRLLSLANVEARSFYETEALRGGWSKRQLERQIGSQFYERTAVSKSKAALLTRGAARKAEDAITAEEEIKDPFVLEFLGLKDEYSESDLEAALVAKIESFLLELGGDSSSTGGSGASW
jgi:predicted nuclease of restriction endonuclease-like (RecB) superfamily